MLMRFDPFRELDRLVTNQAWSGGASLPATFMSMDAYRTGQHFIAHFDLPGVDPDSVELTVHRNVLSVSAQRERLAAEGARAIVSERPAGSYTRRLELGDDLDVDHIEASFDQGVLTIRVPVAEASKPRKVEIATGTTAALASAA